jgi:hypothetical protein
LTRTLGGPRLLTAHAYPRLGPVAQECSAEQLGKLNGAGAKGLIAPPAVWARSADAAGYQFGRPKRSDSLALVDVHNYRDVMSSTNSTSQQLRSALKAAGFNARRVSVRHDHSTLRVTIRDTSVSLSAVKTIADRFCVVRRCEATGEILCGGNIFVDVAYLPELVKPVAAAVVALLAPAADGEVVTLVGGFRAAKISRARGGTYPDEIRIWGPGFDAANSIACGVHWAAQRIAVEYLDTLASAHGDSSSEVRA